MEANNAKSLAEQIEEGTKKQVEAQGGKYKPVTYSDDEAESTVEEREEFTNTIVAQIEQGTKQVKKENKEYEKMFGTKNTRAGSNTAGYL